MLDEPFSALDSHLKSSLEQNLIGLFEQFKGTILYVSHDIDEAFRFCDRIAVVEAGHIMEIGPKENVVNDPQSLAAIKLSGCKNTTPAEYVDDAHVHLPDWGITLASTKPRASRCAVVWCARILPEACEQLGRKRLSHARRPRKRFALRAIGHALVPRSRSQ